MKSSLHNGFGLFQSSELFCLSQDFSGLSNVNYLVRWRQLPCPVLRRLPRLGSTRRDEEKYLGETRLNAVHRSPQKHIILNTENAPRSKSYLTLERSRADCLRKLSA
jgi:hypothetical protein